MDVEGGPADAGDGTKSQRARHGLASKALGRKPHPWTSARKSKSPKTVRGHPDEVNALVIEGRHEELNRFPYFRADTLERDWRRSSHLGPMRGNVEMVGRERLVLPWSTCWARLWQDQREDFFAPPGSDTSRIDAIPNNSLCNKRFYHTLEHENLGVPPPLEFLEEERLAGRRTELLGDLFAAIWLDEIGRDGIPYALALKVELRGKPNASNT